MTPRAVSVAVVCCSLVLGACTDSGSDPESEATAVASEGTVAASLPEPVPTAAADTTSTVDPTDPSDDATPSPSAGPPVGTSDVARGSIPEGAGQELGPLGSTELDIDTGEGSVQLGDADVPVMAETFPIPDGLDVQLSSETSTDAGFSGVVQGSVNQFADFYLDRLPTAGFEITSEQRVPAGADGADLSALVLSFESDQQEGSVAIARSPGSGSASIIVAIAQR